MTTVYLGADHAGFLLKHAVADALLGAGYDVEDLGAHTLEPEDDYPEYAGRVAEAVRAHSGSFGILLCGSAEGMCMAANKFINIRAGVGFSLEATRAMRNDDNANILCIPARVSIDSNPIDVALVFLQTPFSGEARHIRRIGEINGL